MLNDRTGLDYLARLMNQRGIRHLVISPGSRNAPIIEAFCRRPGMQCLSIVDERSAAFFALGMAQQLQKPVALACTSGSAPLNYAPAIAEAYYQRVPLLVLTADRPAEYIDQGDGQTIRQPNVFANYIRRSLQLPQNIKTDDDLWYANRLVSEALNDCVFPVAGPVHVNLPFSEPLYNNLPPSGRAPKDFTMQPVRSLLSEEGLAELAAAWQQHSRKMILVGQMNPDRKLQKLLATLADDPSVVVLTETTSNVFHPGFVACIDRCLAAIAGDPAVYHPELLITLGGAVVSKRIKAFLRKAPVKAHWHVDASGQAMDTYQHLSRVIPAVADSLFDQMLPRLEQVPSEYAGYWSSLSVKARAKHDAFLQDCPWSDLKIFRMIMEAVPSSYDIQLGNSTPVRYSQLFEPGSPWRFDSNRGTSGIDGSVSTAAGACFASQKPTLMITGDIGFFYDSNALWNKHLPAGLRILMINNQGGGIFRFIEGPDQTEFLEEFFEARHQTSAEYLAKAFHVEYLQAADASGLEQALTHFFKPSERPVILEVKSPPEVSADILRSYFRAMS